jgi:hypothetical protein
VAFALPLTDFRTGPPGRRVNEPSTIVMFTQGSISLAAHCSPSQSRVTAMHSKFVQWIILCAVPLTSPAIPTPNPVTCRTDEATSRDSSKDKALLINTPKPDQGSFLASKAMEYIFVRRETTMALILMILQLLETPPQIRVLIHQSHCHRFCQ